MNNVDELKKILEDRAQATANLAYLKAKKHASGLERLARNKYLYFIICADAVKIGISSDPDARLKVLAVGAPSPLKILAKIQNAGHLEAECHKRLAHLKLHGEWFYYAHDVDNLIQELRDRHV